MNKPKFIDYDEYFDEMGFDETETQERKDLAKILAPIFIYLFLIVETNDNSDFLNGNDKNTIENAKVPKTAKYKATEYEDEMYNMLVSAFPGADEYIYSYLAKMSHEIVQTTLDNIDDNYATSIARAKTIAEDMTNTIKNHEMHERALADGYKQKMWVALKDAKTRGTHLINDNVLIPIDEPFQVGDSLMMYPKDLSLGADAREIVNCRCKVEYY